MDKYEYRVKAEQIRKLAEQEDYVSAMKIANTIDWNRVRSIPMLCLIGEIYEKNDMLEESRDVMLIAYDRHPYGRMIIYSLAELSIRLEEYIDAVEYYKEFVQVAPRDTGRYILQYKLYEAQEVGLKERIAVLEEFKRHEYVEKWAFELAYLYHRAGMSEQCVAECDELILWFAEGRYVEKAMELKMLYQPLSEEQQKKYDSRNDVQIEKSIAAVEAVAGKAMEQETEINVKPMNYGIYDTVNLQKELAKSMQQILEATEKETVDTTMNNIKKLVQDSKIEGLVEEKKTGETKELPNVDDNEPEMAREDAEVMAEAAKLIGQITSVNRKTAVEEEPKAELDEVTVDDQTENKGETEPEEDLEKTKEFILHIADAPTKIIPVKEVERELQAENEYDKIFSEDSDGQISICVPDQDIVEKQITGQMSIEEVLQEWERIKAEAAEEKQRSLKEAKAKAIAETEDIMDRLADVVPTITEEMQKMMEDREISEEIEKDHEEGLKAIIEETDIFEDMENHVEQEDDLQEEAQPDPEQEVKEEIQPEPEEEVQEETQPEPEEEVKEEIQPELEEEVKEEIQPELEEEAQSEPKDDLQEIQYEFGDLEDAIMKEAQEALKAIQESGRSNMFEPELNPEIEEPEDKDADPDKEDKTDFAEWDMEETATDSAEQDMEETAEDDAEWDIEETATDSAEWDMEEPTADSAEQDIEETAEDFSVWDKEEAVKDSLEELDELDEFGKEEEPEDEDAVEELQSRLSAGLPEGIESIAGDGEEDIPLVMEADADSFKRIFKYFTEIDGVSDQILDALECIDEISDKGNIVIMGDSATGKTTLAVDIIKAAKKSRNIKGNKVARITGEAMNQKDVESVMASAAGGVLIIETAADMNVETVHNFSKALDETTDTILVIIEDTKERMLKMLESDNNFRNKFTAKIDLPPYTNADLVAFAKSYALEKDCKIDDMGVLALYSRLAELQFETDNIPSLTDVKEMIDTAIEHANTKSIKNMIGTLISKRYDSEHYMILKEKDFV